MYRDMSNVKGTKLLNFAKNKIFKSPMPVGMFGYVFQLIKIRYYRILSRNVYSIWCYDIHVISTRISIKSIGKVIESVYWGKFCQYAKCVPK